MIARLFDRRWPGVIVLGLGCACMLSPGSVSAAGDDTYRFVAGVSEVLPLELSPTAKGMGWTWSEPATSASPPARESRGSSFPRVPPACANTWIQGRAAFAG